MMLSDTIVINGYRVDVRTAGTGEPMLYLHSLIGDFWVPPFLEAVTSDRMVMCPALPGFGASEGIDAIDDVEDLAFHVEGLMESISIDPLDVVAASFGGWIACEVAARWPSRFRSLTLLAPLGIRHPDFPIAHIWGIPPEEMAALLFEDPDNHFALMLSALDLDNPPQEDVLLDFLAAQAAVAKIGWDPYLHNPKLAKRLGRISCPTHIVWGRQDKLIPHAHADIFAALISGTTTELIDGGHLVGLEKPHEVGRTLTHALTR